MEHQDPPRDMTDAEALMWAVEADPWLAPSGATITIFDQHLDFEEFRRGVAATVLAEPRLRQHVVAPLAPVVVPHWEVDEEFDLDWHVRRLTVPGDGTLKDLLDWFVLFLQDPFDRTRPLWQFIVLDGLEGGRGAVAMKIHHVVADGQGSLRLVAGFTDLVRDVSHPDVDDAELHQPEPESEQHSGVGDLVSGALRRPVNVGKTLLDAITHPPKMLELRREVESVFRSANDQRHPAGSPLWVGRSRRRCAEAFTMSFEEARPYWKARGGKLNDFFVTGMVEGAARYHQELDSDLERLHITFVVSTGNPDDPHAFTPVPLYVPAGPMPLEERFVAIRDLLQEKRGEVHGAGPMAALAAVAGLLPTPVVTEVTRAQAAHIDMATSNLPGYLGETYVAGAKTVCSYPLGPVAGTACNVTLYTIAGSINIGMHIDPAAIDDPGLFRRCAEDAFGDLMAVSLD